MAFNHPHNHHQNHHNTTISYCCCQPAPPQPPPPCHHSPPTTTTTDPLLISAIVTHLLQSQNPQTFFPQQNPHKPTSITQNQRYPLRESHQFHPHSPFFSLLQRIDALESSLQNFSPSSSTNFSRFSLKDIAARTIQTHFRAYLVSRSRTLRHLKDLASTKSSLTNLKSSVSVHGFVDFDFLSHKAMDLLIKLDSIQSGDKMIKDTKKSVTREIVAFLEMVDGVCVKRHQVLTRKIKNMRLVRNDNRGVHDARGVSEHNAGQKCPYVGSEEKKAMAKLKERVEKIGRMSKALEEQEQEVFGDAEIKGFKHVGTNDDDIIDQIATNYMKKSGLNMKKNAQSSNAKKQVCFMEDGNMIRVYDIDRDCRSNGRVVDVIEDSAKGTHDEEEALSDGDGEGSSQSSEDMRKFKSDEVSDDCDNHDEEFSFSTPEPAKMEPKPDFMSRKPGVKIVG